MEHIPCGWGGGGLLYWFCVVVVSLGPIIPVGLLFSCSSGYFQLSYLPDHSSFLYIVEAAFEFLSSRI